MPRPSQSRMNRVVWGARKTMSNMVDDFKAGALNATQLTNGMEKYLMERHTVAGILGRMRAGNFTEPNEDDRAFAEDIMRGERRFLDRFLGDLTSGKYMGDDGELKYGQIEWRARLYADRLRGTANEAYELTLQSYPEGEITIYWELGSENSCDECPELAAGSPYAPGDLDQYPGDGSTPCLTNCQCQLRTEGAPDGFGPVPQNDRSAPKQTLQEAA